jgi:hypothetical protein
VSGWSETIQELECGHMVHTGEPMSLFWMKKGQLTECPEGCGEKTTINLHAGERVASWG